MSNIQEMCDKITTDEELDAMELAGILDSYISRKIRYERVFNIVGKIRAEIENHCGLIKEGHCKYCSYCNSVIGVREILELIDKYDRESEVDRCNDSN